MTDDSAIAASERLRRKRAEYAHMGDVGIGISAELGRTSMPLSKARRLRVGDLIVLSKLAGEAFEIRANGHPFAMGEIVVVRNWMSCRVTQFIEQQARE